MAVTYNWGYKPGVANKYGITIAASADDVKPSNAVYIAHWGNDSTGNGSRLKPYKSFEKLISLNVSLQFITIVVGNGVHRITQSWSDAIFSRANIVGDGNVTITGFGFNLVHSCNAVYFYNVSFEYHSISRGPVNLNYFIDCNVFNLIGTGSDSYEFRNCLVRNSSFGPTNSITFATNTTFYRCYIARYNTGFTSNKQNIYYQCNIDHTQQVSGFPEDYSLFYQCNFRAVNNGSISNKLISTVFYPSTPAGYTQINNIADLQTLYNIYSPLSPLFTKSAFGDPKFNNLAIGDFTLAFDSPARNLSYFGTYSGAFSITKALAVKASASLSDFDNSSAVNLTIADNSLTLTNTAINGSIVTESIDNTAGRELQKIIVHGVNADRNGEYVDATSDLASTTINAGTTLTASTPYLVEVGSITYDGNVYTAGQRFTSKATSVGTFTTSASGVVREVLEAPARENVEARFSDGAGSTVDNTATLEELAWYFVEGNTATYNGDTYAVGTFIKVVTGITSFTGSGLLRKVFSDTDPYFYFEINQKPTTNNTGNVRTGAIVRGNGDKDFDRTAANVFPITKKFIQLRYTIQANNLTP